MKVISPLAVYLPRKTMKDKKYILNLNNYRNWHYIVNNQIKARYCLEMRSQLSEIKPCGTITLSFKYFKPSKRKCDRANIYAIQEKFFSDALVYYGIIKDDSDEYIARSIYEPVELDRKNPRVEIEIIEI